jgi:hypothetical protein
METLLYRTRPVVSSDEALRLPPQRVLVVILHPQAPPRLGLSVSCSQANARYPQALLRKPPPVIDCPEVRLLFRMVKYPVRNPLLEAAIKRVFNGRMMVVRQRQRIERLRNLRCSTRGAEQTLQELENSLAVFETHERELKERLNISSLQNRFRKSH